jgi:hypothetical protein
LKYLPDFRALRLRLPFSSFCALSLGAAPARAECLGGGCYDGVLLVLGLGALAVLAVVVLVLWLLPVWLRHGVLAGGAAMTLAALVAVAISTALQDRQVRAMQTREVVGQPPPLSTRVPLLVTDPDLCGENACDAVMVAVGAKGVIALPESALATLDLTAPLALADLPLEHWVLDPEAGYLPQRRPLTPAERAEVARQVDYLVVVMPVRSTSRSGPVEAALRQRDDLQEMGQDELLRLALAPLPRGQATLSLADLHFDLLDLYSVRKRLGLPWPLGRSVAPVNDLAGLEAAAAALCLPQADEWSCRAILQN